MAARKLILILSGEIGSGKSTIAKILQEKYGFKILKTNQKIKDECINLKKDFQDRHIMQQVGEKLDKSTEGAWVRLFISPQKYTSISIQKYTILI